MTRYFRHERDRSISFEFNFMPRCNFSTNSNVYVKRRMSDKGSLIQRKSERDLDI